MNQVGSTVLRRFYNQTFLRMHLAAFTGFFGGVKLCDYLLYDEV